VAGEKRKVEGILQYFGHSKHSHMLSRKMLTLTGGDVPLSSRPNSQGFGLMSCSPEQLRGRIEG